VPVTKLHERRRGIAPLILNLGTRGTWMVSFTLQHPLNYSLGGLLCQPDHFLSNPVLLNPYPLICPQIFFGENIHEWNKYRYLVTKLCAYLHLSFVTHKPLLRHQIVRPSYLWPNTEHTNFFFKFTLSYYQYVRQVRCLRAG